MQSRKSRYVMRIEQVPVRTSNGVRSTRDMFRGLGGLAILYLFSAMPAAFAADPLDAVYAHIDQAAKTFKGLTADITNTAYTAVVDAKNVDTGTIKLLPAKDGTHVLMSFTDGRVLSFDGHKGRSYNPKTNVVDEKDFAQNVVNQYLQLGFGATSAQLKATYDIAYVASEKVGNQQTSHITLIPKSPEMRRDMKQAELWIGENGLAVQQKIVRPDGDYQLYTYSHTTLGAMPEKDLEIKVPSDAKIQKH
jgi:outer membrane lipoprotein-sorting protein